MKKVQNSAAFIFITAVAILSVISIMGVWKVFSNDVIIKSFETLGLLGAVAAIVMVAGNYIEGKTTPDGQVVEVVPNPAFRDIRRATIAILIVVISLLALLGVMAIWDIIKDKEVLYKTIGSMVILAFSSLIIVTVCLNREENPMFSGKNKNVSIAGIILVLILAAMFLSFFGAFR